MTSFSDNLSASLPECDIQQSPLNIDFDHTLLHFEITLKIAFSFLLDLEVKL